MSVIGKALLRTFSSPWSLRFSRGTLSWMKLWNESSWTLRRSGGFMILWIFEKSIQGVGVASATFTCTSLLVNCREYLTVYGQIRSLGFYRSASASRPLCSALQPVLPSGAALLMSRQDGTFRFFTPASVESLTTVISGTLWSLQDSQIPFPEWIPIRGC